VTPRKRAFDKTVGKEALEEPFYVEKDRAREPRRGEKDKVVFIAEVSREKENETEKGSGIGRGGGGG